MVLERVEPHFASLNVLGYQLSDNAPSISSTVTQTLLAPRGEAVISSHFTPCTTRAGLSSAQVGAWRYDSSRTMYLYLSSKEPWNATYTNEEGQAVYKTSTPWRSLGKKVIIDRITLDPSNVELKDHLAEVQYNLFTSSRIKYGGEDWSTSRYFRNTEGQGALGR